MSKSITLTFLLLTVSLSSFATTDSCRNRTEIANAVKIFLAQEYSQEIASNAVIYPYPEINRARVRSYPGDQVCVGEFCIDEESCTIKKCLMKHMGNSGIRYEEFSCWTPESEQG